MSALLDPVLLLPLGLALLAAWVGFGSLVHAVRGAGRRLAGGAPENDEREADDAEPQEDRDPTAPSWGGIVWNLLVGLFLGVLALQFAVQVAATAPGLVTAHGIVGREAPELAYVTLGEAEPASLAEHRGRVVLVNYWATWCPPCRREMPDLDRLAKERGDDGLVVLHLSQEPTETIESWLDENPMSTLQGRPSGPQLPTPALPTSYVIDRQGKVRDFFVGGKSYETFRDAVRPFL